MVDSNGVLDKLQSMEASKPINLADVSDEVDVDLDFMSEEAQEAFQKRINTVLSEDEPQESPKRRRKKVDPYEDIIQSIAEALIDELISSKYQFKYLSHRHTETILKYIKDKVKGD